MSVDSFPMSASVGSMSVDSFPMSASVGSMSVDSFPMSASVGSMSVDSFPMSASVGSMSVDSFPVSGIKFAIFLNKKTATRAVFNVSQYNEHRFSNAFLSICPILADRAGLGGRQFGCLGYRSNCRYAMRRCLVLFRLLRWSGLAR